MELVSFVTSETGTDLIVAFAVCMPDDPMEIETLTVIRTPKFESILEDWEQGARVSFERDDTDDDELLCEVVYTEAQCQLVLRTTERTFELDLRKVDPEEIVSMCDVFRKMNFDGRFAISGM